MTTGKKIMFSLAALVALVLYFGYQKSKKLIAVFEKMEISPNKISGLKINLNDLNFNLDLLFRNPTIDDFSVTGFGVAKLKEVDVYYDGVYLATSPINLTSISIPAQGSLIVHNVPVVVKNYLKIIATNPALLTNIATNFNVGKVTTTARIEVAGQIIEI